MSTAEKLYYIVRKKGSTIPLYVEGIQSEPHHKGILDSFFQIKQQHCFIRLESYIGSHSVTVKISCFFNKETIEETLYVDGGEETKETNNTTLQKVLKNFIMLMDSEKMFTLY